MVRNKGTQKKKSTTKQTQKLSSLQKETKVDSKPVRNIKELYEHKYKLLLWIPIVLLILAIAQISFQVATTGSFITKGVSLKGGVTITINNNIDLAIVDAAVRESTSNEFSTRYIRSAGEITGVIVDSDIPIDQVNELRDSLQNKLSLEKDDFNVEVIGSSLGDSFFREIIYAIVLSFLFMGFVVFLYYRTFIPSLAVILAAFSDIVITIAISNLLGIQLSTAGIAAFLMLIGYSVDTDILLSTRVLKENKGTVFERVMSAFQPGMTMAMTTIGAVTVGLIFAQSDVLKQIMTIILIGLLVDVINTWLQNAAIIRMYMEKKGEK